MKYIGAILSACLAWFAAPALWAAAPKGQYTDLKNGTVRDNRTGLIWQQQLSGITYAWAGAKDYCSQLSLGGFSSGWRLPAKLELESLLDRRVPSPGPMVDPTAFPSTPAGDFWTSTPLVGTPNAWVIYFRSGASGFYEPASKLWARCVHD